MAVAFVTDMLPVTVAFVTDMLPVTVTLAAVTVPDATTLLALFKLPTVSVLLFTVCLNQALLLLQYT